MSTVAVIGAGSWGTALAERLAENGHDVRLWARRSEVAQSVNRDHRNPDYLCGQGLLPSIVATDDLAQCLEGAQCALLTTPSQALKDVCWSIRALGSTPLPLLLCSKGIDAQTQELSTSVIARELGASYPVAVLSGPTHAEEVVKNIPSACVIASDDASVATYFAALLSAQTFRTYRSDDVVGVQLCGAFKNVIAIAVGVSYGLGMGDNTAATLITRGLAEMSRLVYACGGEAMTCMGLAGAGDVVVTCMSRHSRNRVFGEDYLAHNKSLDDFWNDHHMVVEGAVACEAIVTLAQKHDVELPIAQAVNDAMNHTAELARIVEALVTRPLKEEFYGFTS